MQRHYPLDPSTGIEDSALLPWTNGVPSTGIEGSYPPFQVCTNPQEELLNLIGAGLLTGSDTDLFQALRAIRGGKLWTFDDAGTVNAIVIASTGTVHTAISKGLPFRIWPLNTNTATSVTLKVDGLSAAPFKKLDGSNPAVGDVVAGVPIDVVADASGNFRATRMLTSDILALIQSRTRTLLYADLIIYVRTDGNDSNNGLTNTAAGAFLTLQGAWNAVRLLYDTSAGVSIRFVLGIAGTYAGAVFGSTSNAVVIDNVTGAPNTSYIVSSPAGQPYCFQSRAASLTIQNILLSYTYNSTAQAVEAAVWAAPGGNVVCANITISVPNNRANLREFYADYNASIQCAGTIYSIGAGSRYCHDEAANGGTFAATTGAAFTTFTSSGTITYSGAFAVAVDGGRCGFYLAVFTGFFASGLRFLADKLGLVDLAGQGSTFLPGSTAGTQTNGGVAA